jgi:2-keto-3-deoxy-L-rhamnonate aldolase RhmA
MIAAARKHGKLPRMTLIYNETIMPRYIEMGARFILAGQDAAFWRPVQRNAPDSCASCRSGRNKAVRGP